MSLNGKYYQNGKVKGQGYSSKGNRFCTHCHRINHVVENCFVKHGFPPNYKPKGKNQSSNQANSTSTEVSASSSYTAPTGITQEQYIAPS
jgi:hypothetical protein